MNSLFDIVDVLGTNFYYSDAVVKLRKDFHKAVHRLNISRKGIRASRKHFKI